MHCYASNSAFISQPSQQPDVSFVRSPVIRNSSVIASPAVSFPTSDVSTYVAGNNQLFVDNEHLRAIFPQLRHPGIVQPIPCRPLTFQRQPNVSQGESSFDNNNYHVNFPPYPVTAGRPAPSSSLSILSPQNIHPSISAPFLPSISTNQQHKRRRQSISPEFQSLESDQHSPSAGSHDSQPESSNFHLKNPGSTNPVNKTCDSSSVVDSTADSSTSNSKEQNAWLSHYVADPSDFVARRQIARSCRGLQLQPATENNNYNSMNVGGTVHRGHLHDIYHLAAADKICIKQVVNVDEDPLICAICNDKASGLHYGIYTCEGYGLFTIFFVVYNVI